MTQETTQEQTMQEAELTIAEASQLIDFFDRKRIYRRDSDGKHYHKKEWKYLTTGEMIKQGKAFHYGDFVGCDPYVAMLERDTIKIAKLWPPEYNINAKEALFDGCNDFDSRDYEKVTRASGMHFFPFVHKFGLNSLDRDTLDRMMNEMKQTGYWNYPHSFKLREVEGHTHKDEIWTLVDKDELVAAFGEWCRKGTGKPDEEVSQKVAELLEEKKESGQYGVFLNVRKEDLSRPRAGCAGIVPLSIKIAGNDNLYLRAPFPDNMLYLQHNIEGGLEAALIEEEAKPTKLSNGVVVMSEDRIPDYLQRTLGLKGKPVQRGN